MSDKNFRDKLEAILEKREKCIELTSEEQKFVDENIDKMLSSKKCVRKEITSRTGEEIRKSESNPDLQKPASKRPSFEDGNPKNRGFEGGYDSKANVEERETVTPDNKQPDSPTRDYPEYFSDKKDEKIPAEDNSGKIKAKYQDKDYSNTDNAENSSYYEEDRVGRYLQDRDIVVKPIKKGIITVGQVLKVYPVRANKQQAAMVKWSNGLVSHENVNDLRLYVNKSDGEKSKSSKDTEDKEYTPPVKKAEETEESKESNDDSESSDDQLDPPEQFLTNCASAMEAEDPDMSDEDKAALCTEVWRQIVEGELSAEDFGQEAATKVNKGEMPPDKWLEDCKAALRRENADVDNPYAVCVATWNKFSKNKDVSKSDYGTIVKVSPEDMDQYCKSCADKMRRDKIKFLKVTVG